MIIDIHGLVLECRSESSELLDCVTRPFKFFEARSGAPSAVIRVEEKEPAYDSFPILKSSFSTPRNIVFRDGGLKIIDYFGKGIILSDNGREFTIHGRDKDFLQEAFYLLVLSLCGQYCDEKGILRVHALTFSWQDTAVLFSAQSGGGKSTMAFSLLESGDFKLISDDEALIDSAGLVLPFPIRMGTLDRDKIDTIPDKYVYKINRMEFGEKYFVDIEYWNDRLERRHLDKKMLFTAQRLLNGEPYIEKSGLIDTLRNLTSAAVIGFGLYQGMEFVFNSSPRELFSRLPVFVRRFRSAVRLAREAESYKIFLSRDPLKNLRLIEEFLKNRTP